MERKNKKVKEAHSSARRDHALLITLGIDTHYVVVENNHTLFTHNAFWFEYSHPSQN